VRWNAYNKTGYVSASGLVFYPLRTGVGTTRFDRISSRDHRLIHLDAITNIDSIERFFAGNRMNIDLFSYGINSIVYKNFGYFDNPIKLPLLEQITDADFEKRWRKLIEEIRVTDTINVCDESSLTSRLIAKVDRGVWSHTAGYIGEGSLIEATPSGVVETPLARYRSRNVRIGLYRAKGFSGGINQIAEYVSGMRSQIGHRYDYMAAARIGINKMFVGRAEGGSIRFVSPNDLAIHPEIDLVMSI
jgi:hypothetical protein